ncbi:MAG: TlyA family RNA methyltransferase [Coriobacteriales bacterium]|jgi:23S rRNA (cytidine1920-2'-O)/16S rRNA (cytidine1409-2'-O)-methyltransferase|nr:TlyA family RNA methyltransferase [Coriobacteriales bacterium]
MPSPRKLRLDQALVQRGWFEDAGAAQRAILAGEVRSGSATLTSPDYQVSAEQPLELKLPSRYVSRGGDKLAGALAAFDFNPAGLRCLDAGASTGGFTDCLLQAGAAGVTAVDVGYGQFAWKLREDSRVRLIERTNIRQIGPEQLGRFELAVADLSFIALRTVLAHLAGFLEPGGTLIALVKPQFELPKAEVGAGGVVSDAAARQKALDLVCAALPAANLTLQATTISPLKGPKGNTEYFIRAQTTGFPSS